MTTPATAEETQDVLAVYHNDGRMQRTYVNRALYQGRKLLKEAGITFDARVRYRGEGRTGLAERAEIVFESTVKAGYFQTDWAIHIARAVEVRCKALHIPCKRHHRSWGGDYITVDALDLLGRRANDRRAK